MEKTNKKITFNDITYWFIEEREGAIVLSDDPNPKDDFSISSFGRIDRRLGFAIFISDKDQKEINDALENVKLKFNYSDVLKIRIVLQPVIDNINKRNGF